MMMISKIYRKLNKSERTEKTATFDESDFPEKLKGHSDFLIYFYHVINEWMWKYQQRHLASKIGTKQSFKTSRHT